MRVKLRANMVLMLVLPLMREERENEVAEVAVRTNGVRIPLYEHGCEASSLVACVLSEDHERAKSLKFRRVACNALNRGETWWTKKLG